ncbi:PREDICTED: uncharacterized protein C8orf59 homolog, partial [Tinamus guttatus]|uniref:uncharacterized protein C8orf59 homolog n=1 Tax=Tinamus guttatus TaxID=94827 RepID=UPI00052EC544
FSQINIVNEEKVRALNKAFTEIQEEVQQLSKGTAAEAQKEPQVSNDLEHEPANVDAATNLLSQL